MANNALTALKSIASNRFEIRRFKIYGQALPAAALSYSQGGEDVALWKRIKYIVPPSETGFYVDIGCGHPHQISNTFLFYTFGWTGVCIDANAMHAEAWAKHRPLDKFLCAAVGEKDDVINLHRPSGLNWGVAHVRKGGSDIPHTLEPVQVSMRRLDGLLSEHVGDRPITFMCMDVEGTEDGVLASNDWTRWKPYALLIERTDFKFDAPRELPAVRFLYEQGYELRDKIGENILMTLRT